ncbi:lipid droplet-associated hydrolase isoform X1 [Tachysurus ichikawai]
MGSKSECQKDDAAVEHVYCRGAVTELLKYGHKNLHTATKNSNSPQVLILVIPGNPGVVGFYKTFMWTLYQAFNKLYPVWAVSHAGHCACPDTMDMVEESSWHRVTSTECGINPSSAMKSSVPENDTKGQTFAKAAEIKVKI